MLILTRRNGESILIGEDVEVTVCSITATQVRIGIQAPREVRVVRRELKESRPDPEKDSA